MHQQQPVIRKATEFRYMTDQERSNQAYLVEHYQKRVKQTGNATIRRWLREAVDILHSGVVGIG